MNTEELKQKAMAATPGPWIIEDLLSGEVVCASTRWPVAATIRHKPKLNSFPQKQKEVNTQYIATANPAAILELIRQRDAALGGLGLFMDAVDRPPESNCSCHISPPCNDCVENSGLREAFEYAEEIIANAEKQS